MLGAVLSMLACKTEADRACLSQFTSAQAVVVKVEPEDTASVNGSVAALETALSTCKGAGRSGEVEELTKAHTQLSAHKDRLARREELRQQRTELAPEELKKLIESGDPKCPRGQAYLNAKSGQRIRCTGPQPIDMTAAQAEAYFRGRGFKVSTGASPLEVRFEHGAELLVFTYEEPSRSSPPRCVVLYPPPGMSWQEATARATGAAPGRLKPGQRIPTAAGEQLLAVEESAERVIARVGDCPG
jgi:hypothetical protein